MFAEHVAVLERTLAGGWPLAQQRIRLKLARIVAYTWYLGAEGRGLWGTGESRMLRAYLMLARVTIR